MLYKDNQNQQAENHYIWLRQGRIVAAANRLDNQGLISMIARRGWVSESLATEKFQASRSRMAMGLCLKSQGLLTAEQLTLLFSFSNNGGKFLLYLNSKMVNLILIFRAAMPTAEMTGLSMLTNEATIKGLRKACENGQH